MRVVALAAIGVREEKHVRHDAGRTLQISKIGSQDIAQLCRHRGACAEPARNRWDERGQRGAELMGHIGIEGLHLPVKAHGQPLQQRVGTVQSADAAPWGWLLSSSLVCQSL